MSWLVGFLGAESGCLGCPRYSILRPMKNVDGSRRFLEDVAFAKVRVLRVGKALSEMVFGHLSARALGRAEFVEFDVESRYFPADTTERLGVVQGFAWQKQDRLPFFILAPAILVVDRSVRRVLNRDKGPNLSEGRASGTDENKHREQGDSLSHQRLRCHINFIPHRVTRRIIPEPSAATAIAMLEIPPGAVKGLKMWIEGQRGAQKRREEAYCLEGSCGFPVGGTRGAINVCD
jgi:hypothetical protein